MKIGYSDFIRLFRIDDPESWEENLSIQGNGVYVKTPPSGLSFAEQATLTEHPTGNLDEPVLRFPCNLEDLKEFSEMQGLTGYLDGFGLAELILSANKGQADQERGENRNRSEKLTTLILASQKFWAHANQDEPDTLPKTREIIRWLEKHAFSSTLAAKAASIIRPEWAPRGRNAEQ